MELLSQQGSLRERGWRQLPVPFHSGWVEESPGCGVPFLSASLHLEEAWGTAILSLTPHP